jgi:uncharacterized protein DUF4230
MGSAPSTGDQPARGANVTQPLIPPPRQDDSARSVPVRATSQRRGGLGRAARGVALAVIALAAVVVLVLALSAVSLLPRLRNPFAETTVNHTGPALLKSITALSRYEAASGSFQVVVSLAKKSSFLPSFIEGTDTLFIAQGSDIAYVNFGGLTGKAIKVSRHRTAVAITLPPARLEPAVLNVKKSYVFSESQGLLNRIGNFFSSNPNNQHQVYVVAQNKIQLAAQHSVLIAEADKNTVTMLDGLMRSLGYKHITVTFQPAK